RLTARHSSRRIVTVLYSMHNEYLAMSRASGTLVTFFLLSLVNQIVQVLAYVPILLSIGAPVEPIALLALIPLTKAVFQVTPLPAGIGVAEGTIVVTLSLAHVPAEQGLAVAVVMRALDVVLLVPMGIAYCIDAMRIRRRRDPV